MKVWVVRGETCIVTSSEEIWIVGVYSTESSAERAADKERRKCKREGKRVYELGHDDWDVSFTVEGHHVRK